ncbi:MAG: hypothetical protein QOE76_2178 [Frankiales bacterium]|nr:hypothetical protein [Frankiales bacterium]MDX6244455.1 hypothetical protein [Frankiales bacterium]
MSARKTVAIALIVPAGLLGVAGCGTDHGQAKALTACHTFSSANGGGLTDAARTAKLSLALSWAAQATKQSPQWDLLRSSLSQFAAASTQASPSVATQNALRDAHKVIDNACELAARGY